jgi:uncharacterized membrane-anchored protein
VKERKKTMKDKVWTFIDSILRGIAIVLFVIVAAGIIKGQIVPVLNPISLSVTRVSVEVSALKEQIKQLETKIDLLSSEKEETNEGDS